MLTYGEAHWLRKESMRMKNGKFTADDIERHASKMSRKDAAEYYNKKLEKIWLKNIDTGIPKKDRVKAVKYLMYGSHKKGV